ncbi:MAG: beta-lactamase family protein [Asgard group archaeon]|nr:beta-lactamase family protein [Asgard group archaeon]
MNHIEGFDMVNGLEKKENIEKQVEKTLNSVAGLAFDGKPIPKWDEKYKLTDLMKQFNVPGIGMALIDDYQIKWTKYIGLQDVNSKKEINEKTIFEAASTTKAFTAVLALHLVEKEFLDLDEDVNVKLKDWKIPENEFTEKEKVTLRRILNHSAGINRPDSMFGTEEGKTSTLLQVLNGEKPALNDPVKVEFIPGSKQQYSNIGYSVIQKLIEDTTGKSIIKLMKEVIFDPLGMKNSTLEFPLPQELNNRAILPHTADGEAKPKGLHESAFGHSNLSCSVLDMCKFVLEIINSYNGKSEKILTKKMVHSMLESQRSFGPTEMMGLTDQALGMFLMKNEQNTFFLHPGGNAPGATSFMLGSPITGQGAVIFTNGAQGELLAVQLVYTLAKEYDWNYG